MTFAMIAAELQARFARAIFNQFPDALDPYLVIEPAAIPVVALALRDDFGFAVLNNLAGVDYLETDPKKVAKAGFEPHLEVVYHLSSFARPGLRFTFKVILPRDDAKVPSVAGIWRTADWHEREAFDLFGIRFVGHPDPRRILLSEDWVGHPLRKDYEFPLEYHDIRCR